MAYSILIISLSQNIWEQKGSLIHRQRRRAELVSSILKRQQPRRILDIGCAEGYATSYFSGINVRVCGIEIEMENLKLAKKKVKNADFINASIEYLPFRNKCFEAICILEVLEHLPSEIQQKGLSEANYVLSNHGLLIISVPYKENIIHTKCIHCGKMTPLYGHLHSIDETFVSSKLPSDPKFLLTQRYGLPNLEIISCKPMFEPLPLRLWLVVNKVLGFVGKGYWMLLVYSKR
jgi:ubiquinone/menaquinone biosynthesis C-methylase UbiE